jgi:hypothetical protein
MLVAANAKARGGRWCAHNAGHCGSLPVWRAGRPTLLRPPRFGLAKLTDDSFQSLAGMLLTPVRARRLPTL